MTDATVHLDMPSADYFAAPGLSSSRIRRAIDGASITRRELGVINLQKMMATKEVESDSPWMRFGTLCHTAALEPQEILGRYAVLPDLTQGIVDPKGNEYKQVTSTKQYKERVGEWEATQAENGRQVITQDEYDRMRGVLEAIRGNARARKWIGSPSSEKEVSIFWVNEYGFPCKARLDLVDKEARTFTDLKIPHYVAGWNILEHQTYIQSAWYGMACRAAYGDYYRPQLVVVGSKDHYIQAAPVGARTLQLAVITIESIMQKLTLAEESSPAEYPGLPAIPSFDCPPWALESTTTQPPQDNT